MRRPHAATRPFTFGPPRLRRAICVAGTSLPRWRTASSPTRCVELRVRAVAFGIFCGGLRATGGAELACAGRRQASPGCGPSALAAAEMEGGWERGDCTDAGPEHAAIGVGLKCARLVVR
eukprot:11360495-Alexandrium_andersonii.AAC.1